MSNEIKELSGAKSETVSSDWGLHNISDEILLHIFQYLTYLDLFSLAQVSKLFNNVSSDLFLWSMIVKQLMPSLNADNGIKVEKAKNTIKNIANKNLALASRVEEKYLKSIKQLIKSILIKDYAGVEKFFNNATEEESEAALALPLLHAASVYPDEKIIEFLINKGIKIGLLDEKNNTALHIAAQYGNVVAMQVFINKNIEVNRRNIDGNSALHIATEYGQYDVVEFLLQQPEIEFYLTNNAEEIAFHVAVKKGALRIFNIMFQRDDRACFVKNINNWTVFHLAAKENHPHIIQLLLNNFINDKNVNGNTALHIAAENNYLAAFEALIESGADKNLKDESEYTPLDLALQNNCGDIIAYCIASDLDFEFRTMEAILSPKLIWDILADQNTEEPHPTKEALKVFLIAGISFLNNNDKDNPTYKIASYLLELKEYIKNIPDEKNKLQNNDKLFAKSLFFNNSDSEKREAVGAFLTAILEGNFNQLTPKQKNILQNEKALAPIFEYFNNTTTAEKNQEQEEASNNGFSFS